MTQRSQVPKFGNWESEDNVPYTVYFENARKGRSGTKMNPNNPDMLPNDKSPAQVPSFEQEGGPKAQKGPKTVRARHERHMSREDGELMAIQTDALDSSHHIHEGLTSENIKSESEAPKGPDAHRPKHEREEGDLRRSTDSPLGHDAVGRKGTVDSPHHRLGGIGTDSPKRVSRQGLGSDRSIEQSPLHPNQQARIGNKGSGVSSPSWERKGSSEGSHGLVPITPGRFRSLQEGSRLRSVTGGDETPDHGPAVPKFGDWDESDPAAAEGYTHIFNRVREEKQSGTGKVPAITTETSYSNGQKQYGNDNPKGCGCFPWCRK